jgi:hypothetical protein
MKSKMMPFGIALLMVALLLIVGVMTFAGACTHDDGSVSTCARASWGLVGGGVFLAGIAIVQLVVESRGAQIVCAVIAAALGVFIFLVPGTILPLCMMETMHCQAVMKPFGQVMGALAVILGIVSLIRAARA